MKKGPSVLIIDDVPANMHILGRILHREGYRVLIANNGNEGREIALMEHPNIILLDVLMPEENGFEVCRKLRANPITKEIPIVFISALNAIESKIKGLNIGGVDYISKPFYAEEILARVKNCLKLRYYYNKLIDEQVEAFCQIDKVQQDVLVRPEELPQAQFAVHYETVREPVSDIYDVFQISQSLLGYFVGKLHVNQPSIACAAHALKTLLRQNSSYLHTSEDTMMIINKVLSSVFKGGQYLTASFMIQDLNKRSVFLVNAGNPPVLHLSDDRNAKKIAANSDIIGTYEDAAITQEEVMVQKGDRLLLFTPGLVGPDTSKERGYLTERLIQLEDSVVSSRSSRRDDAVQQVVDSMLPETTERHDDVLLMCIDI